MTEGSTVEIPTDEIDSITFSMTNPFNFETKTVKLNSGYEMPIIGIGTYLLSTAQAEESVYHALKVGMRLIDTADIYGNEVGVGRGIRRAMQDFGIFDFELTPDEMQRINALECNHRFASY